MIELEITTFETCVREPCKYQRKKISDSFGQQDVFEIVLYYTLVMTVIDASLKFSG